MSERNTKFFRLVCKSCGHHFSREVPVATPPGETPCPNCAKAVGVPGTRAPAQAGDAGGGPAGVQGRFVGIAVVVAFVAAAVAGYLFTR